jgi:hypothetical protein
MARYGVETRMSPEKVIQKAVDFFGEEGVGLKVIDHSRCCARVEGGGGHVSVTVSEGKRTDVELVTREWDYDVKRFMRDIV